MMIQLPISDGETCLCGGTMAVHFQKERKAKIDNHHVEMEDDS